MHAILPGTGHNDQILERQMRNWELANAQRAERKERSERRIYPCVCVSRMVGSGGRQIGRALAARLGWSFFDRELLDVMANHDEVRKRLYALEDEHQRGLLEDILSSLGAEKAAQRDDYFHRLARSTILVASQQSSIFVGRGIGFLLPAKAVINIRLVASEEYCAARHAVRTNLPLEEARKQRRKVDEDRLQFLRRHFGSRVEDDASYDLTLATDRLTQNEAVEVIAALVHSRFPEPP